MVPCVVSNRIKKRKMYIKKYKPLIKSLKIFYAVAKSLISGVKTLQAGQELDETLTVFMEKTVSYIPFSLIVKAANLLNIAPNEK